MDDDDLYDDDDNGIEHEDDLEDECGLMDDGQCQLAGTEHCDFTCPMRDSEFFCGSKAWLEKHKANQ
jgi:hypothetical protein